MKIYIVTLFAFLTACATTTVATDETSLVLQALNAYRNCMSSAGDQLKLSKDSPTNIANAVQAKCASEFEKYRKASINYAESAAVAEERVQGTKEELMSQVIDEVMAARFSQNH